LLTRAKFFEECSFAHQIEEKVIAGERPNVPNVAESFVKYTTLLSSCWSQVPQIAFSPET
jgi:hypothetical protein